MGAGIGPRVTARLTEVGGCVGATGDGEALAGLLTSSNQAAKSNPPFASVAHDPAVAPTTRIWEFVEGEAPAPPNESGPVVPFCWSEFNIGSHERLTTRLNMYQVCRVKAGRRVGQQKRLSLYRRTAANKTLRTSVVTCQRQSSPPLTSSLTAARSLPP